jgi:UTP--glucose-1-phosphate uridylyltransferase
MISKAIIPVAGWGTRRLPITKAIEKCMLPVGNRPLVDYVVQDCIAAGITDIYFVVSEWMSQVQAYYSENTLLEEYLQSAGKRPIEGVVPPTDVRFHFVTQNTNDKYGTAIPVALAAREFGADEPVVVLMGDDFIYNADGSSEVARLLEATGTGGSAMLGVNIAKEETHRYGVIEVNENNEFVRIVEKPTPEAAPSTLINVSKYVLDAELLQKIVRYSEQEVEGEYLITDPINDYVREGGVLSVARAKGRYLDGGTVEGWLQANMVVINS